MVTSRDVAMDEILTCTLHTLQSDDVREIRQLADTLFVRLVQPFHQLRIEKKFDFRATLKSAMRTGNLLPTYIRQEKTHPKSQLVIAMSLSGIDRCFAVGLIPLLAQLRKYLDFQLYIYTDDLVKAEFSEDGFIANDCDISWNNVLAPAVFARLKNIPLDPQETKLLLIDSLGGKDSEWYESVYYGVLDRCRAAQAEFFGPNSTWTVARRYLDGKYHLFDTIPIWRLPANWEKKLLRNTSERWLETPALREYLIRYIFNPRYGEKKHGTYVEEYELKNYFSVVKERFKSVHLLTPSFSEDSKRHLEMLKANDFVDFHHRANSLEGFAQTLLNIVYGRETDRLTIPKIKFVSYIDDEESGEEDTGHSELTKTFKDCFAKCDPTDCIPETEHKFVKRERGTLNTVARSVPFRDISFLSFFGSNLFDSWVLDPLWTKHAKLLRTKEILKFIKTHQMELCGNSVIYTERKDINWDSLKSRVEYKFHGSRALKEHCDDSLDLYSTKYREWFEKLPLRHVVWCTLGKFRPDVLAISACPSDSLETQRATIFHEHAHWAEHVCPPIGVFTNSMLTMLVREFDEKKVVPVGIGEYAMPVTNPGYKPWIVPYAGKWYRREHKDLPNPTEVLSVHAEYFHCPESLMVLLEHDHWIAKMIAFVFMGGPLVLLQKLVEHSERNALADIEQQQYKASSYEPRRRGGRRKKRETPSEGEPQIFTEPPEERRGFGI